MCFVTLYAQKNKWQMRRMASCRSTVSLDAGASTAHTPPITHPITHPIAHPITHPITHPMNPITHPKLHLSRSGAEGAQAT